MITYRKIGGIHWITIGRLCISWCVKRRETATLIPVTKWEPPPYRPLPKVDNALQWTEYDYR